MALTFVSVAAAGCLLVLGIGGSIYLGWRQGESDLRSTDVARVRAEADQQYQLALEDIEAGSYARAYERLWVVRNLNRAYPGVEEAYEEVRWHLENPPTPTPTPTLPPTLEPGEAPPTPMIDAEATFAEAETAYQAGNWKTAIDKLDMLTGAAPDYQTDAVREMLFNALVSLGTQRINEDRLEEGIVLIDRAALYGTPPQEAQAARSLAAEYLRAVGFMGVDWDKAIETLTELYNRVPEYRDVRRRLFLAYSGYADSYVKQGEYCPAVRLYQNAVSIAYDADVDAKRADAEARCANATPTPMPTVQPTVIPGAQAVTVYSQANLRRGPSQDHEVLEQLGSGALLSATGRSADSTWLFVAAPSGMRGWVFIEVVNTANANTGALPVTEALGGPPAP